MRSLPTKRQSAIDLAQKLRLIRLRDFEAYDLPRAYGRGHRPDGSLGMRIPHLRGLQKVALTQLSVGYPASRSDKLDRQNL